MDVTRLLEDQDGVPKSADVSERGGSRSCCRGADWPGRPQRILWRRRLWRHLCGIIFEFEALSSLLANVANITENLVWVK